jgi:hypothetical protein
MTELITVFDSRWAIVDGPACRDRFSTSFEVAPPTRRRGSRQQPIQLLNPQARPAVETVDCLVADGVLRFFEPGPACNPLRQPSHRKADADVRSQRLRRSILDERRLLVRAIRSAHAGLQPPSGNEFRRNSRQIVGALRPIGQPISPED